ncbi:hypothetical protein UP06_34460 [Bradyrhizobium sp. LTSP857]|nr:hypothetical protein UP06_34460 [Bradyrhizobium sp. LTSP857]
MGRPSRRPRQQQLLLDLVDRQLDEVFADLASERVASVARDAPVAFVDSHLVHCTALICALRIMRRAFRNDRTRDEAARTALGAQTPGSFAALDQGLRRTG